jgi:hypothetical protein
MNADQAAIADAALAGPATTRGEMRVLGPIAVGLALLSALVTFVVLADLTPILPTHYVVVFLLAVNAATVVVLLGVIGREVWQVVQARRSGRAAASSVCSRSSPRRRRFWWRSWPASRLTAASTGCSRRARARRSRIR